MMWIIAISLLVVLLITTVADEMKLLFVDKADIMDSRGHLTFGANPLQHLGKANGIPDGVRICCVVRGNDNLTEVYGYRHIPCRIWERVRGHTRDGYNYEGFETVLADRREEYFYTGMTDIAVNDEGYFLALTYSFGKPGHACWAFGSPDGEHWEKLLDKPVYHAHDSLGLLYDPRQDKWITYQNTYLAWDKPYADNIPVRRVLHIRTSDDGVHWDPSEDVWLDKPAMPSPCLMVPDEKDPEEMEFYRLKVFRYADRYVGMMLNYAACPQIVNFAPENWGPHGPHLSTEWWISRDAMNWERPYRDVFACGPAPDIISHAPLRYDDKLLFIIKPEASHTESEVYGVPVDRLFYIGSMASAQMSTIPFTMPDQPLYLNIEAGLHREELRMRYQSYVMAELLDEQGQVIAGYNKEKCIGHEIDDLHWPLRWEGQDATELAGQTMQLRLYFRDARIYALTSSE